MEFFSIEQIAKIYGIASHQARRRLSGKGSAVDVKVVDKNKKLYSKDLVLLVLGDAPTSDTPPTDPTTNEPKGKIYTPESVKIYANKVIYLKRMVVNLERQNDHLRSQNQNLTTLLAMEKQATLQAPKQGTNDEKQETAQSIGLLFLFVLVAVLVLFFVFYSLVQL